MFQNIQSQFDLIFGKGSPLLDTPTLQAAYDDDEDELDEDEEGSGYWDDSWDEGDEDDDEDDYEEEEDEGTEYRNSSDCLFKAIEKANDSLDD